MRNMPKRHKPDKRAKNNQGHQWVYITVKHPACGDWLQLPT